MMKIKHPLLMALLVGLTATAFAAKRPNIVMIAVDDMNDWIGPLGSNVAKTPNLDRLAKNGVNFANAHTAGVYCAPSRSAIFTGRFASTTGCYTDQLYFMNHPEYRPLQVAFADAGYATYGTGKLFHHPEGCVDQRGWTEFMLRTQAQRENGWAMDCWAHGAPLPDPYPASPYNQRDPKWKGKPFMEVGAIPNDREEDTADVIRARWASDLVSRKHDEPFFVAVGFYAPHFPNYAPQKYFDLYPIEDIQRPEIKADDMDDVPEIIAKKHVKRAERINGILEETESVERTIQGYLACISFADANVGRVLDAIASGPNADNTIVVFWSDHGYAQGQKGHWGKHTLWERTSHVPFIWAGAGLAKNAKTTYTASLLDMYPTLVDLCGLEKDAGLEGESLAHILKSGAAPAGKNRAVFLPYDKPESYAMIDEDWRYIRYTDGSEELYDLKADYHEWNNLAGKKELEPVKARMIAKAPKAFAKPGVAKKQFQLVTEGETFRWEPKAAKGKKK